MAENRRGPHTVFNIQYHLVWVTKYRYKVLRGEVAERARELIRQSCMARGIKILKGHVSKDHAHLLISSPPALSPVKIAQYLKGRSSRLLQQEFSHLKRKYWGQHLWARGYFCNTTGEITTEQIQAYIEGHKRGGSGRAVHGGAGVAKGVSVLGFRRLTASGRFSGLRPDQATFSRNYNPPALAGGR